MLLNSIAQKKLIRILISHAFYNFGRIGYTIFLTLFIWEQTKDLRTISLFYIVFILVHGLSFVLNAVIVKKGWLNLPRIFSMLGSIVVYLLLFIFSDRIIDYLILIAIANGIFSGMYWVSLQTLRFDITHCNNRGNFLGTSQALTIITRLTAPAIGGALIYYNFLGLGYGNIFLLSAFSYTLSILIGYVRLPKIQMPPLHLVKTAKQIWSKPDIVKVILAKLFGNTGYMGAMERLIPIYIFDILQNEFHVGSWLSTFALVAVLTTFLFGRFTPYKMYPKILMLSGSLLFITTLSLVGLPSLVTYIIYGIAREICSPIMKTTTNVYLDNLIHTLPDHNQHRVEYYVIKEWASIIPSRLISYGLLFMVPTLDSFYLQIFLGIMSVCIIIEPLIIKKVKTQI